MEVSLLPLLLLLAPVWCVKPPEPGPWSPVDFPSPVSAPRFCRRAQPSWLCDPDDLLLPHEAKELDVQLQAMYNSSPCLCLDCQGPLGGVTVGVAVLHRLKVPTSLSLNEAGHNFSEVVRSQWELGPCGDDIMVAVLARDRMAYFALGPRTSHFITLQDTDKAFLTVRHLFKTRELSEGIKALLIELEVLLSSIQYTPEHLRVDRQRPLKIGAAVLGAIAIAAILALLLLRYLRRNPKPCPSPLVISHLGAEEDPTPPPESASLLDEPILNLDRVELQVTVDDEEVTPVESNNTNVKHFIADGVELEVHVGDPEQTIPKQV